MKSIHFPGWIYLIFMFRPAISFQQNWILPFFSCFVSRAPDDMSLAICISRKRTVLVPVRSLDFSVIPRCRLTWLIQSDSLYSTEFLGRCIVSKKDSKFWTQTQCINNVDGLRLSLSGLFRYPKWYNEFNKLCFEWNWNKRLLVCHLPFRYCLESCNITGTTQKINMFESQLVNWHL